MPTLFQGALGVLALYWAAVLWRRWVIHARTERFVLDQRRKAGIPDSDRRPLAVAAADATARRQRELARRMREAEDVFGPAHAAPVQRRAGVHAHHVRNAPLSPHRRTAALPDPLPTAQRTAESFYGPRRSPERKRPTAAPHAPPQAKRARSTHAERPAPAGTIARKRHADDELSAALDDSRPRRVRRRVRVEEERGTGLGGEGGEAGGGANEDDVSMEDNTEESMSSEHDTDMDFADSASEPGDDTADVDNDLAPLASSPYKRRADTSGDHAPGDEWTDANGLRWRIGDDGVPRRAVLIVEMRQKYRMPRDTVHPDARVRVPTHTERFLSHDEYEEAKRRKMLAWQHDHALAQPHANTTPLRLGDDDSVEDSLASLVSRRARAQHRRARGGELLYDDAQARETGRRRASPGAADSSFGTLADDSASFTSSFSAGASDALASSRRLSLARSPAPGSPRSASPAVRTRLNPHVYAASPLSSARPGLDQQAKRKREETVMARIRADREQRSGTGALGAERDGSAAGHGERSVRPGNGQEGAPDAAVAPFPASASHISSGPDALAGLPFGGKGGGAAGGTAAQVPSGTSATPAEGPASKPPQEPVFKFGA
ncbi:hypothetical protein MSPP1_001215 [Malassezia sp. CBS 17886]|nr:hypothetical protein MSPP1_001215 [Malassezia sp. CBS 17886]